MSYFGYPSAAGFKAKMRAYSTPFLALRAPALATQMERSDKCVLYSGLVPQLASALSSGPLTFAVTNDAIGKTSHVGVLEFSGEEHGCAYLPAWVMHNLGAEDGTPLTFKLRTLPLVKALTLRPTDPTFLEDFPDPKAVLEEELRGYTCVTKDDELVVHHGGRAFGFVVTAIKPDSSSHACSIVGADVDLIFDTGDGSAAADAAPAAADGGKGRGSSSSSSSGPMEEEDPVIAAAKAASLAEFLGASGLSAEDAAAVAAAAAEGETQGAAAAPVGTGGAGSDDGPALRFSSSSAGGSGAASRGPFPDSSNSSSSAGFNGSASGAGASAFRPLEPGKGPVSGTLPENGSAFFTVPFKYHGSGLRLVLESTPAPAGTAATASPLLGGRRGGSRAEGGPSASPGLGGRSAAEVSMSLLGPPSLSLGESALPAASSNAHVTGQGASVTTLPPVADLFVDPSLSKPGLRRGFAWADFGAAANKSLVIPPTDARFPAPNAVGSAPFYVAVQASGGPVNFTIACDVVEPAAVAAALTARSGVATGSASVEPGWLLGSPAPSTPAAAAAGEGAEPAPDTRVCPSCRTTVPARSFDLHAAFCARNNWACPDCGLVMRATAKATHLHCPLCPAVCASAADVAKHSALAHAPFPCEACGTLVTPDEYTTHTRALCPLAQLQCTYCKLSVIRRDHARHEDACGGRTTPCEHCGRLIARKKMPRHLALSHGIGDVAAFADCSPETPYVAPVAEGAGAGQHGPLPPFSLDSFASSIMSGLRFGGRLPPSAAGPAPPMARGVSALPGLTVEDLLGYGDGEGEGSGGYHYEDDSEEDDAMHDEEDEASEEDEDDAMDGGARASRRSGADGAAAAAPSPSAAAGPTRIIRQDIPPASSTSLRCGSCGGLVPDFDELQIHMLTTCPSRNESRHAEAVAALFGGGELLPAGLGLTPASSTDDSAAASPAGAAVASGGVAWTAPAPAPRRRRRVQCPCCLELFDEDDECAVHIMCACPSVWPDVNEAVAARRRVEVGEDGRVIEDAAAAVPVRLAAGSAGEGGNSAPAVAAPPPPPSHRPTPFSLLASADSAASDGAAAPAAAAAAPPPAAASSSRGLEDDDDDLGLLSCPGCPFTVGGGDTEALHLHMLTECPNKEANHAALFS